MEQKDKQLMIFLAGELRDEHGVRRLIESKCFDFFAADAGYLLADRFSVSPKKILGDFDSAEKPEAKKVLLYPSEKDQTDSELALTLALEEGYRKIYMIAPFGGRLDHTVANLSLLEFARQKDIELCLYDGENLAFILENGEFELSGQYRYISFFPWKSDAVISLEGFKYPLNRYKLVVEKPIGVSNEPQSPAPKLYVHDGAVLCVCIENIQEEL